MRFKSLLAAGIVSVSALFTFANAQDDPKGVIQRMQQQRQQAQPRPQAAPPVFNAPRIMPQQQAAPAYQPRPQYQPRPEHQQRRHGGGGGGGFFPVPVIVPQYIDRPVYQQPYYSQEPRYYQQPQRFYDDEPTYRPRRVRNACRTILTRDKWGGRHYVKKCRPARRYR
jgi:hypothetical protein